MLSSVAVSEGALSGVSFSTTCVYFVASTATHAIIRVKQRDNYGRVMLVMQPPQQGRITADATCAPYATA